jgi:16S rRNA (cytosine1402-N4)-methyltransferase
LRIAVNAELENLQVFLPRAFNLLAPQGRLVVVSFHSLEDRMVKQYFAGLTRGCVCPPDFPICVCGKNPEGKLTAKKLVQAGEVEVRENPRSQSAKLRGIIKL